MVTMTHLLNSALGMPADSKSTATRPTSTRPAASFTGGGEARKALIFYLQMRVLSAGGGTAARSSSML